MNHYFECPETGAQTDSRIPIGTPVDFGSMTILCTHCNEQTDPATGVKKKYGQFHTWTEADLKPPIAIQPGTRAGITF